MPPALAYERQTHHPRPLMASRTWDATACGSRFITSVCSAGEVLFKPRGNASIVNLKGAVIPAIRQIADGYLSIIGVQKLPRIC